MVVKLPLSPKRSGKYISERSKFVKILPEGIKKVARQIFDELRAGNIKISSSTELDWFPKDLSESNTLNLVFVIDTLNYCFWGSSDTDLQKWRVMYEGRVRSGYFALLAGIFKAILNGKPMYNPEFYSKLSLQQVKEIFRGVDYLDIPLLKERFNCLREVGKILIERFDGNFVNCITRCNKNAQELLDLITAEFPCFNDVATYKGELVSFHKRAQILIADVWSLYYGQGISEFEDIDTITMFADYRVPQVLLAFGTLSYNDDLMLKLTSESTLKSGCEEEVEIRGCSIEVVERLKEEVDKLMEEEGEHFVCNSILIDNYLWSYRRAHEDELLDVPFHHVASIYY